MAEYSEHDLASMLRIGEAADELGVSVSTLRNWDRQGKLVPVRHPMNSYRLYPPEMIERLKAATIAESEPAYGSSGGVERRFEIPFVSRLALAEKQIQQAYRPYIQVHKWFARRPGTLFRALLLSEFNGQESVEDAFYKAHDLSPHVVYDPFMGGGTPLLEANRLGMNVVGCDINPMAYWIVRQELDDLDLQQFERTAAEVIDAVERRVGKFYRTTCAHCGKTVPVKYFMWVKVQECSGCGEDVELFPGYLIAKNARHPNFVFFCPLCRELFEVPEMPERGESVECRSCGDSFVNEAVARRNHYTCSHCGHEARYPKELAENGPPRHSLLCMEYHCPDCKPQHDGRFFKTAAAQDHELFREAAEQAEQADAMRFVPDDLIPAGDETTRLHRWGYSRFRELFNPRQLLGLATLCAEIEKVADGSIRHALATAFSDCLRYQNMLARYDTYALKCQDIFSVHGFPVGLVQCENNVPGIDGVGSGGFRQMIQKYLKAKQYGKHPFEKRIRRNKKVKIDIPGETIEARFVTEMPDGRDDPAAWLHCASSEDVTLPENSVDAVITDPPYFDNVQYAELIDFCYVWLRELLKDDVPEFTCVSTRSKDELTGNKSAGKDLAHFTEGLSAVYSAAARALKPGGLFAFTFHHNAPEAYAPVIVALCDAGLRVTAAIPCPAEMGASLHISGTGSSVIDTIICARKRDKGDPIAAPVTDPRAALIDALTQQAAELHEGDVDLSDGDLWCMSLGILAKWLVNRLVPDWPVDQPSAEKLETVRRTLEEKVEEIGLDEAVADTKAMLKERQRYPQQQPLFA